MQPPLETGFKSHPAGSCPEPLLVTPAASFPGTAPALRNKAASFPVPTLCYPKACSTAGKGAFHMASRLRDGFYWEEQRSVSVRQMPKL